MAAVTQALGELLPRLRSGLAARAGWIFLGNVVAALCGLFSLPLLLRLYSQAEFSTYASALAIQQFCMGIAYTSIGMGAPTVLGASTARPLVATLTRAEIEAASWVSLLTAIILAVAWPLISAGEALLPYLLPTAFGVLFRLNGVASAIYRAQGHERVLGVAIMTQSVTRLLVVLALAFAQAPIWTLLAAATLVDMLHVTYHRVRLSGHWLPRREMDLSGSSFQRSSRWMLAVAVMDGAINNLDRIIVGAVLGQQAIGPYHVIRRYAAAFGLIADPFYQVLITKFAHLRAEGKSVEVGKATLRFAARMALIGCPVAVLVLILQPIWQPVLLPDFSQNEITAFYVVFGGHLFSLCFIAVHPALMAMGRWRLTLVVTSISNLAFVVAAFGLGWTYGIVGVAAAVCLQFLLAVGLKLAALKASNEEGI